MTSRAWHQEHLSGKSTVLVFFRVWSLDSACSLHFVHRHFGRFPWNYVGNPPFWKPTISWEHVVEKTWPPKSYGPYFTACLENSFCNPSRRSGLVSRYPPSPHVIADGFSWLENDRILKCGCRRWSPSAQDGRRQDTWRVRIVNHSPDNQWRVLTRSQKSAINNSRTNISGGGCWGEGLGPRRSRQIICVGMFLFISSVFPTANRPNINHFGGRRRPDINKLPGVWFGKISLNYLDSWDSPLLTDIYISDKKLFFWGTWFSMMNHTEHSSESVCMNFDDRFTDLVLRVPNLALKRSKPALKHPNRHLKRSKGNRGATMKGHNQTRPWKKPRPSKRTFRRFSCGSS